MLLISDGENNGSDPVPVARRAFSRGVRIDVRPSNRPGIADLSVERIDLPQEVHLGEPFQFTVWVRADRQVEADFVLDRGSRRLSSGRRVFQPGLNRLVFHDAIERAGVSEYEVREENDVRSAVEPRKPVEQTNGRVSRRWKACMTSTR